MHHFWKQTIKQNLPLIHCCTIFSHILTRNFKLVYEVLFLLNSFEDILDFFIRKPFILKLFS